MKMLKLFSVATLTAVISVTSLAPASALPLPAVSPPQVSNVESVQFRDREWRPRREWNDRRSYRNRDRDRRGWHNGHRGHREYRSGYRRHSDGWWYPLAAFGAGAVIGGALANPPRAGAGASRHVQWCSSRYRTYR